ncbi:MAG TPA: MmcQ/YjbR family DNA-binding protein [Jatrophihabitans sp.]|nr:MmcQ/YjbR family DNA-binding protein [Jatrophihabitans sp.]
MAELADVRRVVADLPRAYEAVVRDWVKFRVGRLVFAAVSPDESLLGFAFPKEAREALVAGDPETFLIPARSDLRYNWVQLRLPRVDGPELADLLVDAWQMCVPKKVAAEYLSRAR